MTLEPMRRALIWLCPVLAVAGVVAATWHMDYAVDPHRRDGGAWLSRHGGMAFNIAIVVDRNAPCIPASRYLLAGVR